MNYQNFQGAFKYGLIPKLPANIDAEVFAEYTDGQNILFQKENEGNFLVATIDKEDNEMYHFLRFISIGGNTQCSIDFQSCNPIEMMFKITELLVKKHTF
jgi:hypothetical protein